MNSCNQQKLNICATIYQKALHTQKPFVVTFPAFLEELVSMHSATRKALATTQHLILYRSYNSPTKLCNNTQLGMTSNMNMKKVVFLKKAI